MSIFKEALNGIKLLFTNFFQTKKRFAIFCLYVLMAVLVIWNSGYSYMRSGASFLEKTIPLVVLVAIAAVIYLMNFDINQFTKASNLRLNKRLIKFFDLPTIYVIAVIAVIVLSMAFNISFQSNLNSYVSLLLTLLASFFIAKTISFEKFSEIFVNALTIISGIAIVIYAMTFLFGTNFSFNYFINTVRGYTINNYLFLYFDFVTVATFPRLSAVFWEPGVFATFLIMGMIFLLVFPKHKVNWWKFGLFVICLIFTQSTAGYLLFVGVMVLYLNRILKTKGRLIFFSSLAVAIGIIAIFYQPIINYLASAMPSIFEKISEMGGSLTTRMYSPYYFFQLFLRSPFFGLGGTTASIEYNLIIPESIVDAGTSTSGYLLAALGAGGILFTIFPIIGTMRNKRIDVISRIILALIFLAFMNKENQTNLLAINIVYMMFMMPSSRAVASSRSVVEPEKKTILSILKSKSQSGVLSRNIFFSFIVKGLALVVAFITIPIYNRYFGDDNTFGVWLVIISVLTWILTFDLGLGNGLKNKLVVALNNNDTALAKTLVSSTYISTGFISVLFLIAGGIACVFVDFNTLMNIPLSIIDPTTLKIVIFIILGGICLEFFVKNILFVLQAIERTALAGSLMLISNVAILLFAALFTTSGSFDKFILLAIVYVVSVNVPLIVASLIIFFGKLRAISPSHKSFSMDAAKKVMTLGIAFFILQIATLFLWSFNDIMISTLYDTGAVAEYTKYYKIFSFTVGLLGTIIQPPIWVAISKAKSEGNVKAIKKMHLACFAFAGLFLAVNLLIALFLQNIFNLWLGSYSILVEPRIVIMFVIYSAVYLFSNATIIVCNGMGALKYLLIVNVVGALVKIPLVYLVHYFFNDAFTWDVVILINTLVYLPNLFVPSLEIRKQYKNLLSEFKHPTTAGGAPAGSEAAS